jgi:hypothetical protein
MIFFKKKTNFTALTELLHFLKKEITDLYSRGCVNFVRFLQMTPLLCIIFLSQYINS